jgi:hypothetical protein
VLDVDPHTVGEREPDGERVGDWLELAEPQALVVKDAVGDVVKVALAVGVKVLEIEPHPEGVMVALTDSVTVPDADPHGEGDREPEPEGVEDRLGLLEPQALVVKDAVGDVVKVALAVGVKVLEIEPHPEGVMVALTDSVIVPDADPQGEGDREPEPECVEDKVGLEEPQVLVVNDAVGVEVKVALPL